MKNLFKLLIVMFLINPFLNSHAQGLLKKIKQKVGQATDRAIDKKIDQSIDKSVGVSPAGNNKNSGPGNKGGAGLITVPPNVNENLKDAGASFTANNYGEARYSVQQAMLGVEMEIGKKILKELPETVAGLKKITDDDQVTSTGWGWAGLTIQRNYRENDRQLDLVIANNSVWMAAVNMYLANGGYAQTTNSQQNWKQTKFKGNRAIIEFDQSSGYKLSVPLGQTSLIVFNGINFDTESSFMNALSAFDVEGIKKTLGEK